MKHTIGTTDDCLIRQNPIVHAFRLRLSRSPDRRCVDLIETRCRLAGCGIRIANAAVGLRQVFWPILAMLVGAVLMVLIAQFLGLLGYPGSIRQRISAVVNRSSYDDFDKLLSERFGHSWKILFAFFDSADSDVVLFRTRRSEAAALFSAYNQR